MKKAMRFMSLLVLIVFLGSNFLTPISYAMDESGNTIDASSEDSSTEESGSNSEDSEVSEEENTNPESITDTEEDSDENSNEDNNDENIVMVEDYTPNQSVISGDVTEEITEDIDSNIQEETQEIQEEINYNKYGLASLANKLGIDWDNEKEIYVKLAGIEDNYQGTREQNEKIREWLIDNSEKIKEYNAIKAKTDSNDTVLDAAKFFHKGDIGEGVLTDAPSSFSGEKDEVLEQSLTGEVEETEIDIAWKTLNKDSIIESKNFRSLGIKVKVEALSGTFPEGTYAEISSVYGEEYENAKQKIIDDPENNVTEEDEMFTFDIKFLYKLSSGDVIEVQPKENKVQVTFDYDKNDELKQADTTEDQEIQIYHINDKDEKGEKVEEGEEEIEKIEINEEKSEDINNGVVIDAESFSYYTIVVQRREEAPESAPTQTWQYGEDYFTISIARPSSYSATNYPIEGFTIMDRNLGASISGTTCNTGDATGACGYLYQWGNNYGFPISANANSILTGVGLTWDDSYNNNGYVSKKFVNGSSFDKDVWSNSSHNDGLWGGANDVDYSGAVGPSGLYWDDGRDRTLRQGPCPEGWHVPSAGEWSMLVDYWYYTNYSSHPSVSSNLYYFSDAEKREAFMNKFYIPFAGYRNYSTADLKNQGSYGYYWSSSPYGSDRPSSARGLYLDSSIVRAGSSIRRASGLSVRCFKDSYVASPESSNLVDTQAWVEGKDFETITISNPENSNEGFTIMDRNLGASISGTVCDKTNNTGSCGFLYQWGNNYGFPITTETVTPVTTGLTWNNVYDNHGYYSTNFINGSSHDYDVWDGTNPTTSSNTEHHDGLWGGANDSSSNNRGANQTNPTDRQGPCPVGYHVPSAGEWGLLIKYWADTKGDGVNKNATYSDSSEGLYNLTSNYDKFQQKFKLPFAGYRFYSSADLKDQGSYGIFWSSSPCGSDSPNYARYLILYSSYVVANIVINRASGLSVRCFKDSYVAPKTYTLTFDSQGGSEVTSQTVVEGQTRSRPPQNPTKTNWTFDNWYTSTGYTALFDFSAPAYANATAYAKWNDGKAPSNVSVTTTSNEKVTTQTATLSCTDEIGVTKYYWGTSSSPNDSAYTPVTSTTIFSTTQTVSSAGIYYLFCKDAAGNTSVSASKTYYTYSVQNMLDKVAGTQGTYNTTNYETNGSSMGTYIVPSGITITLNNSTSYGDPISSHDTYAGYTTSNSGTPTTSNPTITLNTTYYRWYNRDSHTLTLNKGTGISSVSGAGTIKHGATANIDATVTNGYTWVNWTKTSGDTPASATNKATTVVITQDTVLTANASDQTAPVCTITAQPTRTSMSLVAGYNQGTVTFTCTDSVGVATSNLSASNITYNSDIVTLSNFTAGGTATSKTFTFTYSAKAAGSTTFTLKAGAVGDAASNSNVATSATNSVTVDTTAPTITITQPNSSDWTQSKSVTASVNDGTLTMKESTSSTCNSGVEGFVSYADKNYISESDNGKYICYKAVDNVGNTSYLSSAEVEKIDRTAPILSEKTTYNTSWYTSNQTSTFTYTDAGAGINDGYNTAECIISTEGTASICQITPNICDKVGNCNTTKQTSNSIKLDKTAPTFKEKTTYNSSWYNTPQLSTFTYEDTVSGIDGTTTTSCTINEEGTTATCTVANTNICNNAGLCNTTNLTSNSIKLDTTKPTCKIEGNPASTTNQNVDLRVVYLSEVNQITDGYSWDNETYSNTQIRNVSANGTYTAYVKDAAGNTGSCSVTVDKIDKVLPIITINNPTTTPAQSKTITASTNEGTLYMAQTNSNTDCKVGSSLEFGDYASITFGLEANNGTYVCYKAVDAAGNVKYELSSPISGIDTTGPSLGFSANVLAGPVKSNTVTATWGDATVKKWMYSNTSTCSNTESDYNKTDSDSMNQTTQANNGKYICLYAEDSAGNVSKLASVNPINIDITDPICSISGNPENYTNQNVTLTVTMTDTNIDNNGYTWNDGLYSDNKNLTVSSNGTYTAHVRDLAGNEASCNVTVTKIDKTNPVASIDTTATLKSASQTATLSCIDSVGVSKYYRGTTSNPEDSEFTAVTESTTEFSTTKPVNVAGIYYLLCKDTAGNISNSASKTYHSYEVHNMLNAVDKAEGTYNTTNYLQDSTATYLAPAGTTITFANVYSLPTYSTGDQYKGYTTSVSGTPSDDANVLLNDNSTYYFWFNRVKHALTLQMSTGIEHIYYKINSGSEYVMVSETTSVQMKEGSDAYAYATASVGYQLTSAFENYNTDTPKTWNTITAQQVFAPLATKRTDLSYRIKYQNSAGTSISGDVLVENQTFGDEVTVLPGEIAGYITPLSKDITIAVTNPDVIFVYTPKEDIVYTVTYKDTNGNSLLTTKTVNTGVMDTEVTENAPEIDGYTAQTGTLSITLKATNNLIDFVYNPNNNITYTVKYMSGAVSITGDKVVENQTMATTVSEDAEVIPGYTVITGSKELKLAANNNVITFDYTPNEYVIRFVDGSGSYTPVIRSGDYLSVVNQNPPTWTKAGYTIHWDKSIPETMPLNGETITATWTANTYTVSFDANQSGVSNPENQSVTYDSTYGTLPPLSKDGYTFNGWKDGGVFVTEDSLYTTEGNKMLTGDWTANTNTAYTVNHCKQSLTDENDYSECIIEPKTGTTDTETTATVKSTTAGDFLGFTAPNSVTQQTIAGNGSTVVTINYTRNSYDVEYQFANTPSGHSTLPATVSYKYGATVDIAANATAPGYSFAWDRTESFEMPANAVVITGIFTANQYNLSFDANLSGVLNPENKSVTYDSEYGELPTLSKAGYIFNGWKDGENLVTSGTIYKTEGDKILTGDWTVRDDIEYTVTYKDKYGSGLLDDKIVNTGVMNTDVTENAPDIEGYTVQTGAFTIKLKATNNNIHFVYNPNEYAITFVDGSGVEDIEIHSGEYLSDTSTLVYPTWTKAGYTIHWDKPVPGKMPLNGSVITATWTANTNTTYKVKHWKQNIEDDEYTEIIADEEHPTGTTAQQTAAVAKPYVGFTAKAFNQETIAGDESTVVNIYYDRIKSNVSYNYTNDPAIEGAPALPATAEYKYGAEVDVAVLPSLAGYAFSNSWNAEGIVVNEGKFVMPANEVEFTGTWTANNYTITFNANGHGTAPEAITQAYKTTVTVPVEPEVAGYTFGGWYTEAECENEYEFTTMPLNGKVLYAKWTANTNTAYKIEHYKEKLDGTYEKVETEEKTGKTDTTATATPKDYEGFTYNGDVEGTKVSGNIAGNGSLVLKLFYTRNSYDVEYQFANTPSGHSSLPATVSHKYGATVDIAANATAPGYSFAWNRTESFEMPAEDVVITGIFTANTTTPYKVEYYYQQANGEYPTTATSTDTTRKGTTDQTASVTNEDKTPTESGYAFDDANTNNVLEGTIAGNESLVLKVYFKKQFTVRYLTGERGTFEIQTTNNIGYGTFTPNFEGSTDNHEDGYMFAGWAPNKAATVTESVDYVAQWYEDFNHNNQNDAYEDKYTVIITYVYSRGGIAAQTYSVSNQLSGFTYNVDSPDIPNYHADKTNVSGTITGDVNVTITYTPNNDTNGNEIADEDETKHKITVYYNYSRGGIASETQSGEYLSGINYSFTSPAIDYYTPSIAVVSGTGTEENQSFTVVYTPNNDKNHDGYADEDETPFIVTFLPGEHGTLGGTTEFSVLSGLKLSEVEGYQTPTTTPNTHYVFSGWSPSLNVNTKVLSNLTYTAIWGEDNNGDGQNDEFETKYTVTYRDGVDGLVFEDDVHDNILSGTATPTHANPTRNGFKFNGWSPAVAEKVTANATYTATWKVDSNNNGVADEDETYILTINYVYSKGGEAAATHSESILQGAQYSVVSPNIANYQTTDTTVSGTMPGEHTTITVIYTPITDVNHNDIADEEEAKYTLTIQYQDTKGNTVYDDYTAQYVSGASYEKASQTKEHYTIISGENVSGVMPADNLTLTVIYSANLDANDNGIADQNETHYTLTIHYINAQNGTLYPDYSGSYVAGAEYIIASNTSDTNYTIESGKEIVNGIMPAQNTAITVTYTAKNDANGNGVADEDEPHHTLTIHYKNSKGSTIFPDHTESVVEGAGYTVNSPEKEHYTIDKPIVSGTMGEENITVTVTYNTTTADTNNNGVADEDETAHQLTINYNYSRGEQASETVTANYLSGINYSVISPIIANYTANIATVEGIMGDADKTINVIYTPDVDNNNNGIADALDSKYTATVHYVYSRGGVAHADKTQQDILSGLNYSITSPTIAHYTPNRQTVSGTITGDNVEVTVTYTPVTDVNGDGYADEDETKYTVIYTDGVVDIVVFADKVFSNILSGTITPTYNGSLIRTDYLFSGWTPSVATKVIGNATYTAQWKEDMNNNGIDDDTEDKYTITIKDGETIISTQEIVSGAKINLPATPTKDGYVFDGWDGLPDDGKATNENLTITVKWKKVEILPVDNTPRAGGGGGRIISNNTSSSNTTTNEHGSAEEKTGAVNTGDVKNTDDKNISDILNTHTDSENTGQTNTTSPVDSNIESNEVTDAYTWAHNNRITTMPSIEEATPDGYVKRGHLAKMLVNYSVNVLGKKIPAIPKECKNWSDDKDFESDEIRDYAEKACALGLMGVDTENHKFNPNQEVTRAQFGTTISRMLYGDKFQGGFPYYEKHLKILNQKNIMKNVENPQDRIELRKWVWIMLMRVKDLEKN